MSPFKGRVPEPRYSTLPTNQRRSSLSGHDDDDDRPTKSPAPGPYAEHDPGTAILTAPSEDRVRAELSPSTALERRRPCPSDLLRSEAARGERHLPQAHGRGGGAHRRDLGAAVGGSKW